MGKQQNNDDLLHSTGSYIQYLVKIYWKRILKRIYIIYIIQEYNNINYKRIYIYIKTDSLCCIPETNITF